MDPYDFDDMLIAAMNRDAQKNGASRLPRLLGCPHNSKSFMNQKNTCIWSGGTLSWKGIEIYCAPNVNCRDMWQASMLHIAHEGGCFVLYANQFCLRKDFPPPPEYVFFETEDELTPESVLCTGGSVIISPSETVLAGPNYSGEGLIFDDLGIFTLYVIALNLCVGILFAVLSFWIVR